MQITATFESIEEMQNFARRIAGETGGQVKDEKPEKKTVEVQKKVEPKQEPQSEPEPQLESEPQKAKAEAPEETETVQEETAYTLEEVRAKLAQLQKAGKRAEVKELLGSFGVAKLSELPAEKYAVLMVKAGEL